MDEKIKILLKFSITVFSVIIFSIISVSFWQEKPEQIPAIEELNISPGMTVQELAEKNRIALPVLKKVLNLKSKEDLNKKISEFGQSVEGLSSKIKGELALSAEYKSKNWFKIPLKFFLWFIFLFVVFINMIKKKIEAQKRVIFLMISFIVFGIILGADPSPMGTVKDAIVLYGVERVIFPPRMIALSIFLLLVLVANKYICAWGCQIGTLQDYIFRFNRNNKDTKGIIRQLKVPFMISNSVRVLFFIVFSFIALNYSLDIFEFIDPFKLYKPLKLGFVGAGFVGFILALSLFVYRPWCHFFCPFGLLGWIFEKLSLYRIRVNYDTCIACDACQKACPSTVMNSILKGKGVVPDCFACGTCINVCPTDSISFSRGKRQEIPEGKFSLSEKV